MDNYNHCLQIHQHFIHLYLIILHCLPQQTLHMFTMANKSLTLMFSLYFSSHTIFSSSLNPVYSICRYSRVFLVSLCIFFSSSSSLRFVSSLVSLFLLFDMCSFWMWLSRSFLVLNVFSQLGQLWLICLSVTILLSLNFENLLCVGTLNMFFLFLLFFPHLVLYALFSMQYLLF